MIDLMRPERQEYTATIEQLPMQMKPIVESEAARYANNFAGRSKEFKEGLASGLAMALGIVDGSLEDENLPKSLYLKYQILGQKALFLKLSIMLLDELKKELEEVAG